MAFVTQAKGKDLNKITEIIQNPAVGCFCRACSLHSFSRHRAM